MEPKERGLVSETKTNKNIRNEDQKIDLLSDAEKDVVQKFANGQNDKYGRFFLAVLSAIPWIMPLSVIANLKAEFDQDGMNSALRFWISENQTTLKELIVTVNDMLTRLDSFGDEIKARIESPDYLALVRKGFKVWSDSETQDKRLMIKKLLTNAGAITLCPDDQVRLFIDWIDRYHEAHFAVMREIYQNKSITKAQIYDSIHPQGRPRDNSAEAGLFSFLIRELNMGGIIHQERQVNFQGQTIRSKRSNSPSNSNKSDTLESPFESTKRWELSELGKEFVRYVMEDVDLQLNSS